MHYDIEDKFMDSAICGEYFNRNKMLVSVLKCREP